MRENGVEEKILRGRGIKVSPQFSDLLATAAFKGLQQTLIEVALLQKAGRPDARQQQWQHFKEVKPLIRITFRDYFIL